MKLPGCWASIDPGMRTGIAIWDSWDSGEVPVMVRCMTSDTPDGSWLSGALALASSVAAYLAYHGTGKVYIEQPAYHGSPAGQAVAAKSLVKLAMYVGALAYACRKAKMRVSMILIRDWKGNLPKAVSTQRIITALGSKAKTVLCKQTQDAIDAVGIGLYVIAKGVR
mgnify:CR=1 FL=1